ncbi:unnamed protein product [Spirodela intermedia]|uniref:NB-ARC domain-containing protein n=1 Tax=Spirodela intermedia TaxID=51605 RepID=A0ABN7E881_SPIIN|nr:unnamed protein product [Spirodela intermedia]
MNWFFVCLKFFWNHIPQSALFLIEQNGEALSWVWNLRLSSPVIVIEQPTSSLYSNMGAEETLSEIRRLLEDDEAEIIEVYGIGGIGKTTLLKAMDDELLGDDSSRFDLVIWVIVSKELDVLKVQEDIGVRLGYCRPGEARGTTLLSALSQRRFLLLLDDLWEKLDLGAVGVPDSLRNGSKIVFTTRSLKVCNEMDAQQRVKVPLLNQASSWKLFCQRLGRGEDQWDPSMKSLASAAGMADATTRGEWEEALKSLKGIPAELGDMKEVLTLLKFSFDRLKDTSARDQLIEYCVGEGLLERGRHPDSIDRARNRGSSPSRVSKLPAARRRNNRGREVKLHDTVREMALWITSGEEDEKNVFLVNSGERLTACGFRKDGWSVLPEEPSCDNLQTLLLNNNHRNPRWVFPVHAETSCFRSVENRNKPSPRESGRWLNCSSSIYQRLREPLEDVYCLKSIPREAVSSLSGFAFDLRVTMREKQLCLKDLDGLGQLTELGLSITGMTHEDMQAFLDSHGLCASIRFLCMKEVGSSSFDLSACLQVMKGLRTLFIEHSTHLEELIFNTNQPSTTISWKDRNVFVRDLSTRWHPLSFPSLERVVVSDCLALKKLPFGLSSAKNIKEIRGE